APGRRSTKHRPIGRRRKNPEGRTRPASRPCGSGEDRLYDATRPVGEPEIAAVVTVREAGVLHPEQVEDGRVQVVDADAILHGLESDLVGRSVMDAAFRPAAAATGRERVRVW